MSGPPETPLDPGDFSDAVTGAAMAEDQQWGVLVAQDGEHANIVLSKSSVRLGRRAGWFPLCWILGWGGFGEGMP